MQPHRPRFEITEAADTEVSGRWGETLTLHFHSRWWVHLPGARFRTTLIYQLGIMALSLCQHPPRSRVRSFVLGRSIDPCCPKEQRIRASYFCTPRFLKEQLPLVELFEIVAQLFFISHQNAKCYLTVSLPLLSQHRRSLFVPSHLLILLWISVPISVWLESRGTLWPEQTGSQDFGLKANSEEGV